MGGEKGIVKKENTGLSQKEDNVVSLDKSDKPFNNNYDMGTKLGTVGTLELTEKECKILYEPFTDDDLDILPDSGIVYAPWVSFMKRLRDALKGAWGFVPDGMPRVEGQLVVWPYALIVRGKLISYAIGECRYIASNSKMTYGDACEGAKSNAIMRNCKGMGIGIDTWNRKRLNDWKKKHAEKFPTTYKGQAVEHWRRKDGSNKYLYLKLINYLLELLEISESVFMKKKGKVSLELCNEDQLLEYKNELELNIRKKITGKKITKMIGNSKDRNKMILKINKMLDKKFDTAAQKTAFLKKYNVSDLNKVDIDVLKKIGSELSKEVKSDEGPRDKKPVKKEKDLTSYMKEFEGLTKQLKMSTDQINELTKDMGNDITVEGLKKLIKDMKIKLKEKGSK
jgi:hypothetical protein